MSKKSKTIQVELNGETIETAPVAETAPTAETAAPTKTRVRKPQRELFLAKVANADKTLDDLSSSKYSTVSEEFTGLIDTAHRALRDAAIIANAVPADWKPGKGTRNGKKNSKSKFAIGDVVQAKEKHLESFAEMGIGNGPWKVLGVLPVAKQIKLVLTDGTSTYIPLNLVERVAAAPVAE